MKIPKSFKMKWWGWGLSDYNFPIEEKPGVIKYLHKVFKISDLGLKALPQKPNIKESALPSALILEFKNIVGDENISIDQDDRIRHISGKSYKDLIRLRTNQITFAPDAIIYPTCDEEVFKTLKLCQKESIAVIPFGGGSSVVGGVDALASNHKYCITLDLSKLSKILEIDQTSMLATVQTGIFGPTLEDELNQQGLTLGHFPQSFEFSTLGGWIAARSSGQNSIYYGPIEKMINSVTMITPQGEISTIKAPRTAQGPSIKDIIIGSEGTLGVITKAVLKVSRLPIQKKYYLFLIPSFLEGSLITKALIQNNCQVSMIRVSDEEETEALFSMSSSNGGFIKSLTKLVLKFLMKIKGIKSDKFSSIIIGLEGSDLEVCLRKKLMFNLIRPFKFLNLGTSQGKKWLHERFLLPYLRDNFLDHNLLIDTLETSATWSNLIPLYEKIVSTIKNSFPDTSKEMIKVFTHISHVYPDGASLYITILLPQNQKDPIHQWMSMKKNVNNLLNATNAPLSHHHGIGIDHKDAISLSALELDILKTLKEKLDPSNIMNPGKLL